jgi:hypothetical protein
MAHPTVSAQETSRRTRAIGVVTGALVLVGLLGLTLVVQRAASNGAEDDCQNKVEAAEAKLRTDRRWTERDIPGIGNYREIHWQVRALGHPCPRAPGPTDYAYQGIVFLRPADAAALARRYDWAPVATSGSSGQSDKEKPSGLSRMSPPLARLAPAGVRWRHSEQYAENGVALADSPDLYLDPDHSVAFFTLHTS